jgi:hypothetical protein
MTMPSTKTASDLKPAQVMLSEVDRELQRTLRRRLLDLGVDTAGPTILYRAGLRALVEGDDNALVRAIDQAENRMDVAELEAHFQEWCRTIAASAARREPALEYAYDQSRPGSYSHQGRFVSLGLMRHDGRVLIDGLAAMPTSVQVGQSIPIPQLFPGGLATMLSLNEDGAKLATEAIIVWLLGRDHELNTIRAAIQAHSAQPSR